MHYNIDKYINEVRAICASLPGGGLTKIVSQEHARILSAMVGKAYVLDLPALHWYNLIVALHSVMSIYSPAPINTTGHRGLI